MAKTTITKILFRRGSDYDRKPTILDEGEPGWVTDTCRLYVGDGRTEGAFPVLNIRTPENAPLHAYNNELKYEPIGDITGTSQPPTQEVLALNHEGLSANLTRDWMDDRYVLKDPCLTNSLTNPADPVACDPNNDKLPTQVMQANLVTEGDVIIHGQANMTTGVAVSGGIQVQNGGVHVVGDSTFEENLQVKKDLQITGTTTGTTAVFEQLSLTTPLAIEDGGTGDDTGTKVANWDTAFGWGDHSQNGYLKSVDLGSGLKLDPSTGKVQLNFGPTSGLSVSSDGTIQKGLVANRRAGAPPIPDDEKAASAFKYAFIIDGNHTGTNTDTVPTSGATVFNQEYIQGYHGGSFYANLVLPHGEGSRWKSVLGAYDWATANCPGGSKIIFCCHSCDWNDPKNDDQLTGLQPDTRPKSDPEFEQFSHYAFLGAYAGDYTDPNGVVHPPSGFATIQHRSRVQVNCGRYNHGLPIWFRQTKAIDFKGIRLAYNFNNANIETYAGATTSQQAGTNFKFMRVDGGYCHFYDSAMTIYQATANTTISTSMVEVTKDCDFFTGGDVLFQLDNGTVTFPDRWNLFHVASDGKIIMGTGTTNSIHVYPPTHTSPNSQQGQWAASVNWHYLFRPATANGDGSNNSFSAANAGFDSTNQPIDGTFTWQSIPFSLTYPN